MFSPKKLHVVIGGILAGLAITYQEHIQSTWESVQKRLAVSTSASNDVNSPIPSNLNVSGWGASESNTSNVPSTSLSSNSSYSGHFRSQGGDQSQVRESNPGGMVSASAQRRLGSSPTPTLRIASFNMQAFGESKLKKAAVTEVIARLIRQFDVIALQHIQSRLQNVLPELIDKVNQADRRYEYCIGPRVGSEGNQQQFAFVFDTDRIETDRQMLYTVDDPQRAMEYEPLVGWFRCRLVPASDAFTFSLVNVRMDPLHGEREWKLLPDLVRCIRQDGRQEDDVILIGDFGCSDKELAGLKNVGMIFALEEVPTTVSGEAMLDNIVFPARATDEFTGKSGVVDFLRQGNLSIDQALQISSHMPIWGEFFAIEGGKIGYIGNPAER